MTSEKLIVYLIAIFVHSYLHGYLPSVFKDYFSTNDTIHTHNPDLQENYT